MQELLNLLIEKNLTIGSCESLTAGLFTSTLASIPGASAVLRGGIVSYHRDVKEHVVGVDYEAMKRDGVVSIATAIQMAQKARVLLACDICVSFTGNAGPDVMEEKPAGYVCCAIANSEQVRSYELQISGDRNQVRCKAVEQMVEYIKEIVKTM